MIASSLDWQKQSNIGVLIYGGRKFLIQTDHYSLKYLLEQHLTTSPQQHRINKLLGFDFRVDYKAGSLNKVVGALSRGDEQDDHDGTLFVVSQPTPLLFADVKAKNENTPALLQLQDKILNGELDDS